MNEAEQCCTGCRHGFSSHGGHRAGVYEVRVKCHITKAWHLQPFRCKRFKEPSEVIRY